MLQQHKKRVYTIILMFLVLSFVSVTYAWFTYSNSVGMGTDVLVKAWFIEFKNGDNVITNDLDISSNDIYPGMETIHEEITIDNLGDSDALLSVDINEARILNKDFYEISDTQTSYDIQDALSHNYPFKINVNLSSNVLKKKGSSTFEVSISWPIESGDDELDTYWGQEAYLFNASEAAKHSSDETYQIKRPIALNISVVASQDIDDDESFDDRFQLGDEVLYDVVNDNSCLAETDKCLRTTVIDLGNVNGDEFVTLLPDINYTFESSNYGDYDNTLSSITSGWKADSRSLTGTDVLKVISKDVQRTTLDSEDTTPAIVGNVLFNSRAESELTEAINLNGYFSYSGSKFTYLNTSSCVWTDTLYGSEYGFAINNVSGSKLYNESVNTTCKVVPVILADKINIFDN